MLILYTPWKASDMNNIVDSLLIYHWTASSPPTTIAPSTTETITENVFVDFRNSLNNYGQSSTPVVHLSDKGKLFLKQFWVKLFNEVKSCVLEICFKIENSLCVIVCEFVAAVDWTCSSCLRFFISFTCKTFIKSSYCFRHTGLKIGKI